MCWFFQYQLIDWLISHRREFLFVSMKKISHIKEGFGEIDEGWMDDMFIHQRDPKEAKNIYFFFAQTTVGKHI